MITINIVDLILFVAAIVSRQMVQFFVLKIAEVEITEELFLFTSEEESDKSAIGSFTDNRSDELYT